jgi:hypothetical protein
MTPSTWLWKLIERRPAGNRRGGRSEMPRNAMRSVGSIPSRGMERIPEEKFL